MQTLGIIDGNSIGYMAHNSMPFPLTRKSDGMETTAIYGFLNRLTRFIDMHPNIMPIVVWDGFTQWRQDLLPLYKSNRSDTPEKLAKKEAFRAQRPHIIAMLRHLGIFQIKAPEMEADDVAGVLSNHWSAKGGKVLMLSSDQDWLQLINANTSWEEGRSNKDKDLPYRVVNIDNFKEFTLFNNTREFIAGMAIAGDSSDCIDGVYGFGDKTCAKIMSNYKDVNDLIINLNNKTYDIKNNKMNKIATPEMISLIERNHQLVNLLDLHEFTGEVKIKHSVINPEELVKLFKAFDLNKFAADINNIEKKFRTVKYNDLEQIKEYISKGSNPTTTTKIKL